MVGSKPGNRREDDRSAAAAGCRHHRATVLGTGEIVLILNPVQLALKEVAARPSIVHEAPKPQAVATQPTIMVVDDSLTVRKVTGRLLERHGYIVVTRATASKRWRSCWSSSRRDAGRHRDAAHGRVRSSLGTSGRTSGSPGCRSS